MRTIRNILSTVLVLIFFSTGCAGMGGYGSLRLESRYGNSVTTDQLIQNWRSYHVAYAGVSTENPSAVLFDPKEDDRTITSDKWIPIQDQETFEEAVHWLRSDSRDQNIHHLWRIMGPDGAAYGYMLTAWNQLYIKQVDKNVLWLDDLPLTPADSILRLTIPD